MGVYLDESSRCSLCLLSCTSWRLVWVLPRNHLTKPQPGFCSFQFRYSGRVKSEEVVIMPEADALLSEMLYYQHQTAQVCRTKYETKPWDELIVIDGMEVKYCYYQVLPKLVNRAQSKRIGHCLAYSSSDISISCDNLSENFNRPRKGPDKKIVLWSFNSTAIW